MVHPEWETNIGTLALEQISHPQSNRFVVVYRAETREIEGADIVWRGWVERIPDPRQREIEKQEDDRLGFNMLSELPDLISRLIERSGKPSRPAHKRSPSA